MLEDEDFLDKMLKPIQNSKANSRSSIFNQSDSLMKILLRIEALQHNLIDALMQILVAKLSSTSGDENDAHNEESAKTLGTRIFNHIRWTVIVLG